MCRPIRESAKVLHKTVPMKRVPMRAREEQSDFDDEGRWWRLDFTTILLLLVIIGFLMIVTFEFWHTHFGVH